MHDIRWNNGAWTVWTHQELDLEAVVVTTCIP